MVIKYASLLLDIFVPLVCNILVILYSIKTLLNVRRAWWDYKGSIRPIKDLCLYDITLGVIWFLLTHGFSTLLSEPEKGAFICLVADAVGIFACTQLDDIYE